ncbi:MAG TPA: hypothetical protein VJ011_03895 [Steroidobacteraceae bacterium]|nr:hypothetical protein [Steroidobacteraceae bacterium]
MRNKHGVGAAGRHIHIASPPSKMAPAEALELAAWLVAAAAPLTRAGLDDFHRLLAEAGEGTELGKAALEALEGDDT